MNFIITEGCDLSRNTLLIILRSVMKFDVVSKTWKILFSDSGFLKLNIAKSLIYLKNVCVI